MAMMTTMIHDNKHTCHHTSAHTHLTTVLKYVEICGYVHVRMERAYAYMRACMRVSRNMHACLCVLFIYPYTHGWMLVYVFLSIVFTWHANNNT